MKFENQKLLQQSLIGKKISDVRLHGGHGLILTIMLDDNTTIDIGTYDDGEFHDVDDFYVGLNKIQL